MPDHMRHCPGPAEVSLRLEVISDTQKSDLLKCLRGLHSTLEPLACLTDLIKTELALIGHFIYRNQNRFRNDKGLKTLKQVRKCAERFLEVDVSAQIMRLKNGFPLANDILIRSASQLYFPSKEMVKHILNRLEGAFLLMEKLDGYAVNSGVHQIQRLNLGHFWTVALDNMAVLGRLHTLAKIGLFVTNYAYTTITPIFPWMPAQGQDEVLSLQMQNLTNGVNDENLKAELNSFEIEGLEAQLKEMKPVENPEPKIYNSSTGVVISRDSLFSQLDTPKVKGKNTEMKDSEKKTSKSKGNKTAGCAKKIANKSNPVKRELKVSVPAMKAETPLHSVKACSKNHLKLIEETLQKLVDSKSILNFIDSETKNRKLSRKDCVTRKLDQQEWKCLRTNLREKCLKSEKLKSKAVRKLKELIYQTAVNPRSLNASV